MENLHPIADCVETVLVHLGDLVDATAGDVQSDPSTWPTSEDVDGWRWEPDAPGPDSADAQWAAAAFGDEADDILHADSTPAMCICERCVWERTSLYL